MWVVLIGTLFVTEGIRMIRFLMLSLKSSQKEIFYQELPQNYILCEGIVVNVNSNITLVCVWNSC